MSKRIQIIFVLSAWLLATGVQWDLVQVAGWGKMFATYSQTMSLTEAVKKTFSGEMCGVCEVVSTAKQGSGDHDLPGMARAEGKLVCISQAAPVIYFQIAEPARWTFSDLSPLSAQRATPPTPPPRVA